MITACRGPRPIVAGLVVLTATAALAACGDSAGKHGTQSPGGVESATTSNGTQVLEVTAGDDLRFQQTDLRAHTGQVTLDLKVTGDVPHNLILSSGPLANSGTGTVSNGTKSITLTFSQPGTYGFLCTIHPKMKGTITVS